MSSLDLILPSFFADALSLGPHWVYDVDEIEKRFPGGIDAYASPMTEYHGGRAAGDFTHYGDQTLALLRSVAKRGDGWSIGGWRDDWQVWAEAAGGYKDGATRETLEHLKAGLDTPSASHDLGGASRIAPLFAVFSGDDLIHAARAQTRLTHGDPRVVDAAEFLARSTLAIRDGAEFGEAFDRAAAESYEALPAADWLAGAREVVGDDFRNSASRLGLSCEISKALPLTLMIALRWENDAVECLKANAMAGGDSAARGLPLGLMLGAKHGLEKFPPEWRSELNHRADIEKLVSAVS